MTQLSADPVSLLLDRFASRRRRLLLLRSLATATLALLAALALAALVDRFIVLSIRTRSIISLAAYAAATAVFLRAGGWRWLRDVAGRRDAAETARMIETAEPALRDRLLAAVELRDEPAGASGFRRAAVADAGERARRVRVARSLPRRLAAWRLLAAAAAVAIVALLVALPNLSHLRLGRLLGRAALPTADIPRASRFDVRLDGFAGGVVPAGEPIEVAAVASAVWGPPPTSARVEVTDVNDRLRSYLMKGTDGRFTADVQFDAVATVKVWVGDADTRAVAVTPVPRPAVVAASIAYEPPAYLPSGFVADPPSDGGAVDALAGSRATVEIEATRPVSAVTVELLDDAGGIASSWQASADGRRVTATVPVSTDGSYRLRLLDAQTGFESRREPAWPIVARPDLPPTVTVAAEYDEHPVAADDYLPLSATAADDVLLDRLALEAKVDGGAWEHLASADIGSLSAPLDLLSLGTTAGDRVTVRFTATDAAGQATASAESTFLVIDAGADPTWRRRLAAFERVRASGADMNGIAHNVAAAFPDTTPRDGSALRLLNAASAEGADAAAAGAYAGELAREARASALAEDLAAAARESLAANGAEAVAPPERTERRRASLAKRIQAAMAEVAAIADGVPQGDPLVDRVRLAEDRLRAAAGRLDEGWLRATSDELAAAAERLREAARRADERAADARLAVASHADLRRGLRDRIAAGEEASEAVALQAAVESLQRPSPELSRRTADLSLIAAAARAADPSQADLVADAAATLDAGYEVAAARMAAEDMSDHEHEKRGLSLAAAALRDRLLVVGHDAAVARLVGNGLGVSSLIEAEAAAEPAMAAARESLRSLLPDLSERLAEAASEVRAGGDAEDATRALREEAARQDLLDAAGRERARDAAAAAERLGREAGDPEALAETLDRLAEHFAGCESMRDELRAGESPAEAAERDRLDALAEAAESGDVDRAAEAMGDDPAMREELARAADERQRRAAELLREAAALEAGAERDVAEAAANVGADRAGAMREVADAARSAAGRAESPQLADAAEAAERGDAAAAAKALREAERELRERADAARQRAEEADRAAAEQRQRASDAFEEGGDFATPFREMERQQAQAEQSRRESGQAAQAASEAAGAAERAEAERDAPRDNAAAVAEARERAEAAQEAVKEKLDEAARQMEAAAEHRERAGDDAGRQKAEQSAGAAKSAAKNEVAAAAEAAGSGEGDAESTRQALGAAKRAIEAQAKAASPGGPPGGKPGRGGTPTPTSPGAQAARAIDAAVDGPGDRPSSRALGRAAAAQANAVRQQDLPPLPQPGEGSQSDGTATATTAASGEASGTLGDLPAPDGGAWGRLPAARVREVIESRRDAAPAGYEDAVEAYYRAVAARAGRGQ